MFRRGITLNLNNYESERLDVEFPVQLLPPGITDPDAAFAHASAWVDHMLRAHIEVIVRREAARGNRVDAPIVGPPEHLVPPAPLMAPQNGPGVWA